MKNAAFLDPVGARQHRHHTLQAVAYGRVQHKRRRRLRVQFAQHARHCLGFEAHPCAEYVAHVIGFEFLLNIDWGHAQADGKTVVEFALQLSPFARGTPPCLTCL